MALVSLDKPRLVPRDGHGRPLIVPKTGGKAIPHIRTTTFIDCLEDKTSISDWRARGTLVGAVKFPEVAKDALTLDPNDPEGKRKLNALAERVFDMAGFNDKREKGTHLHLLSESVDEGRPLPPDLPQVDFEDMMAYMSATIDLTVKHIEEMVVVNELPTAGTPDRVSLFDGIGPDSKLFTANVITDLKTGDISYGQLKIGAQLATYARGEFYDHTVFPDVDPEDKKAWTAWKKIEHDPELAATAYRPLPPDVSRDWGIVINLRPASGEASLHWVDLQLGWEAALLAKEIRRMRSLSRRVIRAFD